MAGRVVAAAGQDGAAGPKRSSGNSAADDGRVVERRPDDPRRRLDEHAALDAAVRQPVVAGASVADLGIGADRHGSDPDRVPDRLHLEEGGDPFGALGGAVVEPVEAGVGARSSGGAGCA